MNNIVKVNCIKFLSDWTDIVPVEIDLDKYVFFEIDYRGNNSWHIIGHRCDENHKWDTVELSLHEVNGVRETAKFIAYANAYPKSKGKIQDCKVSRFNNLHYSGQFYKALEKLLEMVHEEEQVYKNELEKVMDN